MPPIITLLMNTIKIRPRHDHLQKTAETGLHAAGDARAVLAKNCDGEA
jgi:hypothetical protein